MRMGLVAAAVALAAAGDAGAQRMVTPGPGAGYDAPDRHADRDGRQGRYLTGPAPHGPGSRWGSKVDGHWWAGANAPGGWRGYRRLQRGYALPGYWHQPGFAIDDWSAYGLGQPPVGYSWTRYYDDAVLIDGRGQVYDDVDGVDWDGTSSGYADGGYAGAGYPPPPPAYPPQGAYAGTAGYPQDGYVERRNSGVGGAVAGAAVGGVAGNLIAGRGNRLAGTLVGAGVGGAAGYAIDRSSTHRVPVAPRRPYDAPPYGGPGAGYPPPPPMAYAPPPPPPPGPAAVWHSPDGGTTITTTSVGGYAGGSTTVVTVQTAPVVTTTTTEIVEDNVTWSRPHARWHPVRHHKWVRRPACGCR